MRDVLEIVSALSLTFQKDGLTCVDYLDAFETATLELTQLSMGPGEEMQKFLDEVNAEPAGTFKGFQLTHYNENTCMEYNDLRAVCVTITGCVTIRFEGNNLLPLYFIIKM